MHDHFFQHKVVVVRDGWGKGTHQFLFLTIMMDKFDAFPQWPFRQTVTLLFLEVENETYYVVDCLQKHQELFASIQLGLLLVKSPSLVR